MKVSEIIKELNLKALSGGAGLEKNVTGGYVSDLLSDVMGNANEGEIWITLQTHENVMAVASLKDLAAVILVKNFQPDENMLERSIEENIAILSTSLTTFEIAGKLYNLLQ